MRMENYHSICFKIFFQLFLVETVLYYLLNNLHSTILMQIIILNLLHNFIPKQMKLFKLNVVVVAIFLMTSLVSSQNNFYKKVIHNTDPEAKCLDGSPAFFYIH